MEAYGLRRQEMTGMPLSRQRVVSAQRCQKSVGPVEIEQVRQRRPKNGVSISGAWRPRARTSGERSEMVVL